MHMLVMYAVRSLNHFSSVAFVLTKLFFSLSSKYAHTLKREYILLCCWQHERGYMAEPCTGTMTAAWWLDSAAWQKQACRLYNFKGTIV
jgi:hypothetical protein